MTFLAPSELTSQQQLFLDALAGEAKGDPKVAKELAGYASTTALSDIVRPLKDNIIALTKDILMNAGPKAAHGMVDVIDNPAAMGAANKIKAASEVLNRIGVNPPAEEAAKLEKLPIFIMPPKDIKAIRIEDGTITIDMNDNEPKTVEAAPKNLDKPALSA